MTDRLIRLDDAIEIMANVADAAAIWFNKDRSTPIQDKLAIEVMAQFAEFCVEQLEALSAIPAVGGWMDIESARQYDGAKILAFCPTLSPPEQVCVWSETWKSWQSHPSKFGRDPIKWQPIPAPPEIE